jgi:hypothetical protein
MSGMASGTLTANEVGADRFDTIVACVAMLGSPVSVENEGERDGLDVMREMAARHPKWARIVLDIVQGKREMPSDLEPAADDAIATTAWHVRAALIVAAAGTVPELTAEDRRVLSEILAVTDDPYDDVLERVSGGTLTPATKRALLVDPLQRILNAR